MLVNGCVLLSNVPPMRLIVPLLTAMPGNTTTLLPASALRRPPALFKSVPENESVPFIDSTMPVLLTLLLTTPAP